MNYAPLELSRLLLQEKPLERLWIGPTQRITNGWIPDREAPGLLSLSWNTSDNRTQLEVWTSSVEKQILCFLKDRCSSVCDKVMSPSPENSTVSWGNRASAGLLIVMEPPRRRSSLPLASTTERAIRVSVSLKTHKLKAYGCFLLVAYCFFTPFWNQMKEITLEKHHMPGNMHANWCLPGSSIVLWSVKWDMAKGKYSVSVKIVLRTYVSEVRVRAFQARQWREKFS